MKNIFALMRKNAEWTGDSMYLLHFFASIALLVGAGHLNLMVKNYIAQFHSPASFDILHNLLPVMKLGYIDVWAIIVVAILAIGGIIFYFNRAVFIARTLALLYVVRSFFILLTPLGIIPSQVTSARDGFLWSTTYVGNDFFFSGHVALPFMLALLFWDNVWLRISFLFLTVLLGFGVIASRIHYSIDVFAAPFIVYGVFMFAKRFLKFDTIKT